MYKKFARGGTYLAKICKVVASVTIMIAVISSSTFLFSSPTVSASNYYEQSVELVNENFENTTEEGIRSKFEIYQSNDSTYGTDYGVISNTGKDGGSAFVSGNTNEKKPNAVMKFLSPLTGDYSIQFDYKYSGGGDARVSYRGIVLGSNFDEGAANYLSLNGDIAGYSGIYCFFWQSYVAIFARTWNGTNYGTSRLANDVSLANYSGFNVNGNYSNIKFVKDDNVLKLYANNSSQAAITITLGNLTTVQTTQGAYQAYTSATTSVINGSAYNLDNILYADNASFVNCIYNNSSATQYIDNLKIIGDRQVLNETVNETFSYDSLTEATIGLNKNFKIIVAGSNTFGNQNSYGINFDSDENKYLTFGNFAGLKYNKALNTAYSIEYSYKVSQQGGTDYNAYLCAIFANRLEDANYSYYTGLDSGGYGCLGESGLVLYCWNSNFSIYAITYNDGYGYSKVIENASIGSSITSSNVQIKVTFDGDNIYKFYFNNVLKATIVLSDNSSDSIGSKTYNHFTTANGITNGSGTAYKVSNCAIPSGDTTFAFGSRPVNTHKAIIDNIIVKESKDVASVNQLNSSFLENFTTTTGNELKYLLDNWQVYYSSLSGPVTFGTSMNITDGAFVIDGFDVLKYKKNLGGAIRFSYDLAVGAGAAGSPSGAAVIYRVNSGDPTANMSEGYPTILSSSGIIIYIWDSWMMVAAATKTDAGAISNSTIANNVYLGSGHSATSTSRYTIDDDGNGNINIFCDTFMCCSIKLSETEEVTVGGSTYTAYRKAECTYAAKNGDSTGLKYTATKCLIAKDTSTVGFARRGLTNARTMTIDNVSIKATSETAYQLPVSGSNEDEQVGGLSATISRNVGISIYISTTDYPTASYVKIVKNDKPIEGNILLSSLKTNELTTGTARGQDLFYPISYLLPAKEMNTKISIVCYDSNNEELFTTKAYSPVDYAKLILSATAGTYSNETISVCKAMLNYGAVAQTYFNYDTDNLANKDLEGNDKILSTTSASTFSEAPRSYSSTLTGLKFDGVRISLDSVVDLKLYFLLINDGSISNYSFKGANDEDISYSTVNSTDNKVTYYVFTFSDITPDNYNSPFVLNISKNGTDQTMNIQYSIYGYFRDAYNAKEDNRDNLTNLIDAMYAYSTAVNAYVASLNK